MNDLYHWHSEVLVTLEMEKFKREIDAIRLLHDAGLSNPGVFERAAIALGNALINLGGRLKRNFTEPNQAYQVTSSKYAA